MDPPPCPLRQRRGDPRALSLLERQPRTRSRSPRSRGRSAKLRRPDPGFRSRASQPTASRKSRTAPRSTDKSSASYMRPGFRPARSRKSRWHIQRHHGLHTFMLKEQARPEPQRFRIADRDALVAPGMVLRGGAGRGSDPGPRAPSSRPWLAARRRLHRSLAGQPPIRVRWVGHAHCFPMAYNEARISNPLDPNGRREPAGGDGTPSSSDCDRDPDPIHNAGRCRDDLPGTRGGRRDHDRGSRDHIPRSGRHGSSGHRQGWMPQGWRRSARRLRTYVSFSLSILSPVIGISLSNRNAEHNG